MFHPLQERESETKSSFRPHPTSFTSKDLVLVTINLTNKLWIFPNKNGFHDITVTIWIPNTSKLDSMGVRYSNGKVTWLVEPFEYQTFWKINRPFSVHFSDHHFNDGLFDNWTQIYHLNTRLVQYSDGYCTKKTCFMI